MDTKGWEKEIRHSGSGSRLLYTKLTIEDSRLYLSVSAMPMLAFVGCLDRRVRCTLPCISLEHVAQGSHVTWYA